MSAFDRPILPENNDKLLIAVSHSDKINSIKEEKTPIYKIVM